MLFPKTRKPLKKFRKARLSENSKSSRGLLTFPNSIAVRASCVGFITSRQIEAVRRYLKRNLKKRAFLYLRIFPDTSKTKKPEKARMGKGKGRMHLWFFTVSKGKILFEAFGNSNSFIKNIFRKIKYRLHIKTLTV